MQWLGIVVDSGNPSLVVVFSGKRKSGKDYIADLLLERCGDVAALSLGLCLLVRVPRGHLAQVGRGQQ